MIAVIYGSIGTRFSCSQRQKFPCVKRMHGSFVAIFMSQKIGVMRQTSLFIFTCINQM